MNKIIKLFFILIIIVSCNRKNEVNINKKYLIKEIANFDLDFIPCCKNGNNNFIGYDNFECDVFEFNKEGIKLKQVGGLGKGPGEFAKIFGLFKCENNLYVFDHELRRITIFSDTLKYINSFYLPSNLHNFTYSVIVYKDTLFLFGRNIDFKNWRNPQKNFNLGLIFTKSANGRYKYIREIIKIEEFPKIDNIPIGCFSAIKVGYKIYLLYSLSADLYVFNIKNNDLIKIPINFPNYINPLHINYTKLKKTAKNNWNLDKVGYDQFCFSPNLLFHDKINNKFIVQFRKPLQILKKNTDERKYVIIIFDENFKFEGKIETNKRILFCENKNDKVRLFLTILPDYYKNDWVEPEKYKIEKCELIEEEK